MTEKNRNIIVIDNNNRNIDKCISLPENNGHYRYFLVATD